MTKHPAVRTGTEAGSEGRPPPASARPGKDPNRAPAAPDGTPRPGRRGFPAEYKLAILAEYDRCSEHGEKGALLRREGLYSSLVSDWRRQHREGSLVVSQGRSEGGRGGPSRSELERLRAENERLRCKLAKAEAVIEVQGKVHALLEEISKSAEDETE